MFDGQDQILDSERFDAQACGNEEFDLMFKVQYRLAEYWMTNDEINEFVRKAFDFAIETGSDPQYASRLLVCIVVHLDVCTVQQENETVYSVNNRVISAEKLVPFYIWPVATGVEREQFDKDVQYYLLKLVLGVGNGFRPRIRVEDVEEGLAIMPLCDICLRGPDVGDSYIGAPFVQSYFSFSLHREEDAAAQKLSVPYVPSSCVSVYSGYYSSRCCLKEERNSSSLT